MHALPDPFPDECGGREDGSPPEPPTQPTRRPADLASVFARWNVEGPLVHEPTGLVTLDEATGGGPVYGSRWYILGAPDAGKTALLIHVAHELAMREIAVGLLAVDEEDSDVATRFAQRVGFERVACETRTPEAIAKMRELVGGLPLRLYDSTWTIEEAADDLAAFARSRGVRAMLGIDSVQTVQCHLVRYAERELTEVRAVGLNVQAIRTVATHHRLIVMTTSEMSRLAYTTIAKTESEQTDTMGAAKWSGAIEYSARVMLSLRNVKGEEDVIALEIPKNKHGRKRLARDGHAIYLTIDRARQVLAETDYTPPEPNEQTAEIDAARSQAQTTADAAILAAILARSPGATTRDLRARARAAAGTMSNDRVDAALARLDDAVVRRQGARNALSHYLYGSRLSEELLGAVDASDRNAVIVARPPAEPQPGEAPASDAAEVRAELELEAEQRVAAAADDVLAALAQANANGAEIRSRTDLLGLARGSSTVRGQALTLLITSGRIVGGRGRPYAPRAEEPPAPENAP